MVEAERLVKAGVKELLVISQDTSAYGLDLKYAESTWRKQPLKARFLELSEALGSLGAWVRLHYVYPYPHVDEVIPLMAEGKILPYLDIPFQHAAPNVLKAMKRPGNQAKTLERIKAWRRICPDLAIRSTFIVGFPGETDDDFRQLHRLAAGGPADARGLLQVRAGRRRQGQRPARRGSRGGQGGALAYADGDAARDLQPRAGRPARARRIDVLIDEIDEEGAIGRSAWDAPEIDGCVFLNGETSVKPGDMVRARITDTDEYDLWGEVVRR